MDASTFSFSLFCAGVLVVPAAAFVYVAIATAGGNKECHPHARIWLITDCIVFAFMVPEFFGHSLYVYRSKIRNI
jgi:hypothetical protein